MSLSSNHFLSTPIEYLKGVGPQRGELLRKELSLNTYADILTFYPNRYMDRTQFTRIMDLQNEGDYVQIKGKITYSEIIGEGRAKRLVSTFKDETGVIELVWFQGINWIEKIVANGGNFIIFGKLTRFNQFWNIMHPEMEKIEAQTTETLNSFYPVYPSSEKLKARGITGKIMVKMVQALFVQLQPFHIVENLPDNIISEANLMSKYQAVRNIHFPANNNDLQRATFRLKYEELFIHQIGICKLKLNLSHIPGFLFFKVGDYFNEFYKHHLPFELTEDQKKVLREIRLDTQTGNQMNRLLQGDVGSGKTIVAVLCMLLALDNGFQACLMAPTEILAQQHYLGIRDLLAPLGIQVGYLSGKVKIKERRDVLKGLANGEIQIVIGTHALLEDPVVFFNIGLVIIDEQHRFGVAQRAKMWKKNTKPPHILVMTATPIPRTLAMTSYGDLDVSVIEHLPPGRKPISTIHRTELYRAKVMDFIRSEVDKGRQAYIVYPLIDESEKVDYENLEAGYEQVKQFFPAHKYNIAKVHGKQDAETRESNMNGFVKGKAQIMVATTVIEVGVNVPNASVMLIESAERFGLSQLHQLRGRVGRGADKSYCILLTSDKISAVGRERMSTMVNETSGFAISEKDLGLRGPGEIDGTRQSGAADLKIADIIKDVGLMELTRNKAIQLLQSDPNLQTPQNQNLRNFLLSRKDKEVWSKIS
jgi:ATP-dependent DNA helicase RecG